MSRDIENRADVEQLVNTFYDKVKQDQTIGFIFKEIIGDDWSHHLPIMYSFWEMVLLAKHEYKGNPVMKHVELDQKIKLEKVHFDRWLELWNETVDELFAGENADQAKNKGMLMANLISMKVEWARTGKMLG